MFKYILCIAFFICQNDSFSQEKAGDLNICSISKLLFVGSNNQKKVLLKKSYYNQLGLLVKEQNFSTQAPFKESLFYYNDTILYCTESLDFDMNVSKSNFLYDQGCLKEKISEIENGVILKTEYKYDKNGNIVQQWDKEFRMGYIVNQSLLLVSFNPTGQKSEDLLINNLDTVSRTVFIYNNKAEIVKKITYSRYSTLYDTQSFEYDSFGNLIKKTVFESEKSLRVEEYLYENNRLISVIIKGNNGDIINTENRFYNQVGLTKVVKNDLKLNKKEIEFYERGQIKEIEFWEQNKLSSKLIYSYASSKKHDKK